MATETDQLFYLLLGRARLVVLKQLCWGHVRDVTTQLASS